MVVQYYDKSVSTFELLLKLNMTYGPFDVENICPSMEYSCESVCPLKKDNQERSYLKSCYCDQLCVEFGDCCFDYFERLVNFKKFSFYFREFLILNFKLSEVEGLVKA